MSNLIDLANEARGIVNDELEAAAGVTWPVYDTVPQGTRPPFLKIGAIETSDEGRPGEQFERITVELIGVYQGGDRAELGAAMFAARQAIDDMQLTTARAKFACQFVSGAISDVSKEDGLTYVALSTFELLGEPA